MQIVFQQNHTKTHLLTLTLFIYFSLILSLSLSLYLSTYLSIYPPICLSIYTSIYLPIYLRIYLSPSLSFSFSCFPFVSFSSSLSLPSSVCYSFLFLFTSLQSFNQLFSKLSILSDKIFLMTFI